MTTTLDAALGAMRDAPRWFLYRLTWNATAAKYDKAPCPLDGSERTIDASLPANWATYADARAALDRLPRTPERTFTLGHWLTAGCGFFLLDIDQCADGAGNLTQFAAQLVAAFPGALVEWSSSRKGVHVIARAEVPPHRSRDAHGLHLELYDRDRGIAFGLTGAATGSADTCHDAMVERLVAQYFPPRAVADGAVRPEWRGPADDDALIRKMLGARQSAESAFGGKSSLRQLWEGAADKNSENDMALASHLAFWTGCDAERMVRLMLRSGMVRDKWKDHRTYLSMTVGNACAACVNVYQEPQRAQPKATQGQVRSAAELMQQTFTPVQWAIKGILPEGVTILSGDPKIGKSWLVWQMCIAVAAGVPLWDGRDPETQGEALYLDLEGNERRLQRRLSTLLGGFSGNLDLARLHFDTAWARAEEGVTQIADWLRKHPGCRLVVIDTVSAFRDNDPGRKSAYAHDYAVGEMLKPLAKEFSCAIVLVMHNRKAGAGDFMHKVSGTQGMTGSVDNVLVLERDRGNHDAALSIDGRDIEEPAQLALRFEGGPWRCVGNVADVQRSKERNTVLQAIVMLRGAGTAKDIHEAMGGELTLSAVRMRLSRMVKAGELRNDNGLYTAVVNFTPVTPPLLL